MLRIEEQGDRTTELLPCWINERAQPVGHEDDADGIRVADYIRRMTADEGFDTEFEGMSGRLVVRRPKRVLEETTP